MAGVFSRAMPRPFQPLSAAQGRTFWEGIWGRGTASGRSAGTPSRTVTRSFTAARAAPRPAATRAASQATRQMQNLFRTTRRSFWFSARRGAAEAGKTGQESLSFSARLKKMSKEYGWTAVGVYFTLSILDFPFFFLLVKVVGTERIGAIEHWVVSHLKALIPEAIQNRWHAYRAELKKAEIERMGNDNISEHVEMAGWGIEKAEERNRAEASLGTQLALAYAIHKSFIFVRVPLTAAILPKVVKVLRSWGWQIGKRRV